MDIRFLRGRKARIPNLLKRSKENHRKRAEAFGINPFYKKVPDSA